MRVVKRRAIRVWKTLQALAANVVFGFPGRKLRVVGVTGTDGKTTTVHLIVAALESAGYTVGAVSTIHFQVGTRKWTNTSKLTTPSPWALAKLLAHMVRAGCHYVVVECSSHRLDQNGLWGIPVDVAVMTNITREHFDYHRDFDDYAAAKRRLFRALRHAPKALPFRTGIDPGGRVPIVAVVNLDDARCARMLEEPAERKYGFSLGQGAGGRGQGDVTMVTAKAVGNPTPNPQPPSPTLFVVRAGEEEALLHLKLPGRFNLQNALAAIAVGVSQGIELARITRDLSEVDLIPGRMDLVACGQPFTVVIDYAVTPAAFEALYQEIRGSRQQAAGSRPLRITHVFGAAGERDRGKRPLLGEIAGRNADLVILTDEDPFNEDPEQILDDVARGLEPCCHPERSEGSHTGVSRDPSSASPPQDDQSGCRYLRIRDRRLAIREALQRAQPGDVVLVTGKGAEETMAVGARRLPWNDRQVIEEEMRAIGFVWENSSPFQR